MNDWEKVTIWTAILTILVILPVIIVYPWRQ